MRNIRFLFLAVAPLLISAMLGCNSNQPRIEDWGSLTNYFSISDVSSGPAKLTNPATQDVVDVQVVKFVATANHDRLMTPVFHAQFLDTSGVTVDKSPVLFGGDVGGQPAMNFYVKAGQRLWGWVVLPREPYRSIHIVEGPM